MINYLFISVNPNSLNHLPWKIFFYRPEPSLIHEVPSCTTMIGSIWLFDNRPQDRTVDNSGPNLVRSCKILDITGKSAWTGNMKTSTNFCLPKSLGWGYPVKALMMLFLFSRTGSVFSMLTPDIPPQKYLWSDNELEWLLLTPAWSMPRCEFKTPAQG